jgi:major vault protein
MSSIVVRLKPFQYVHVHDNNTNLTRTVNGPATYTLADHEALVHAAPQSCVAVPPMHYCTVKNPAIRDAAGNVDASGAHKSRVGDVEIRFNQPPFPLFPGEAVVGDVTAFMVLSERQALRLRCDRDFTDGEKGARQAGEDWVVKGPLTYKPRVEVTVVERIEAQVVDHLHALVVRARFSFTDRTGAARLVGEEWLVESTGAFIPDAAEEIVSTVDGITLSSKKAVHVQATDTFTDRFGKKHTNGEQWLITEDDTRVYFATPQEKVVKLVGRVTITPHQYCVVSDFVDAQGVQHLGQKELRKGPSSFFLHPAEVMESSKPKDVFVLAKDEGLVLFADLGFSDAAGVARLAGERWMIRGPCSFTPSVEMRVVERRKAIPLDLTEGVYIRNTATGSVRAHIGSTVMLTEVEELWKKPLAPLVHELLSLPRLTKLINGPAVPLAKRVEHRVVTCNVPHNSLVQVYDFEKKTARVVPGPELVALQPHEEFTVMSLSGAKPKRAGVLKTLAVGLGPDFMTDVIIVETRDHARLQMQLAYSWEFDKARPDINKLVFNTKDFVGDACKAIASRIRGAVAAETFDQFHRGSTSIIRHAVFADKATVKFENNGLIITSVDIHSVDPVDPKTRDALTKSVQLAIEITTKTQEAKARHHASSLEQVARGKLERQVIGGKAESEKVRMQVLAIEAANSAIESAGASTAQAQATAEGKRIEGEAEVQLSSKRSDADLLMLAVEIDVMKQQQDNELDHLEAVNELYIHRERQLAAIEAEKFQKTIAAIGTDTIVALAKAGPALQAKLLGAMGLQGYMITDGTNPINLFNTAKGMTAQGQK